MAATVEELKDMIVDLKIDLVKANIPKGHCPYAYYPIEKPISNCDGDICEDCKKNFFNIMRKAIEEKVKAL